MKANHEAFKAMEDLPLTLDGDWNLLTGHARDLLQKATIAPFGASCLPETAESGDEVMLNLIDTTMEMEMYHINCASTNRVLDHRG